MCRRTDSKDSHTLMYLGVEYFSYFSKTSVSMRDANEIL